MNTQEAKKTVFATVVRKHELTKQQVQGLLVGLLEGNYSPWLQKVLRHNFTKLLVYNDFCKGGKMQAEEYFHPSQIIPVTDGCSSVWLVDDINEDGKTVEFTVDAEKLQAGMQVFADKYPRHFQDFIDENDDAITADVFGQCVVYGEIVFG